MRKLIIVGGAAVAVGAIAVLVSRALGTRFSKDDVAGSEHDRESHPVDGPSDTYKQSAKPNPVTQPSGKRNQGEGDKESARRYNEGVREFVNAGKVEPAAAAARHSVEGEESALAEDASPTPTKNAR